MHGNKNASRCHLVLACSSLGPAVPRELAASAGPVLSLALESRKGDGGRKPQQSAGGDRGKNDSASC